MSLKIEKRFKKATKEACDLAKDEAVLQKHPKVTSLHVLVGLFLQNGEAAKILKSEGVTLEKLRRQLAKYNTKRFQRGFDAQGNQHRASFTWLAA